MRTENQEGRREHIQRTRWRGLLARLTQAKIGLRACHYSAVPKTTPEVHRLVLQLSCATGLNSILAGRRPIDGADRLCSTGDSLGGNISAVRRYPPCRPPQETQSKLCVIRGAAGGVCQARSQDSFEHVRVFGGLAARTASHYQRSDAENAGCRGRHD